MHFSKVTLVVAVWAVDRGAGAGASTVGRQWGRSEEEKVPEKGPGVTWLLPLPREEWTGPHWSTGHICSFYVLTTPTASSPTQNSAPRSL